MTEATPTPPQFALDPTDEGILPELRHCWPISSVGDGVRDDYMLVRLDPPWSLHLGGAPADMEHVILATRHQGFSLYPLPSWPAMVYVFTIQDRSILSSSTFTSGQVELAAWGVLYSSMDAARNALGRRV